MRKQLNRLRPGHQDLLFALATLVAACTATVPWTMPDDASWTFRLLGSVQVGWAVMLHLWLLFGDAPLGKRVIVNLAWSLPPIFVGAANALLRAETPPSTEYLARLAIFSISHRLIVVGMLAMISIAIQSLLRWRLARLKDKIEPRQAGIKIVEIMMLTVILACGIVGVRENIQSHIQIDTVTVFSIFILELLCTLIFIVLPTVICLLWRPLRKWLPWMIPTWAITLCLGVYAIGIALFDLELPDSVPPGPSLICLGSVVAGMGIWLAGRYGYHWCHLQKAETWKPSHVPEFRWSGFTYAAMLMLLLGIFHYYIDISVLSYDTGGSIADLSYWRYAWQSRQISRLENTPVKSSGGWHRWDLGEGNSYVSLDDGLTQYVFEGRSPKPETIELICRGEHLESVYIEQKQIDSELLNRIGEAKSVDELTLDEEFDLVAFEDLLSRIRIEHLSIHKPTIPILRAIKQQQPNLQSLGTNTKFELTEELAVALSDFLIDQLWINLNSSAIPHISNFKHLTTLTLEDSELTPNTIEQIVKLNRLSYLHLDNCKLDKEGVILLGEANLESLEVTTEDKAFSPDMLLPLADKSSITFLYVEAPTASDLHAAKFNRKRGEYMSTFTAPEETSLDGESDAGFDEGADDLFSGDPFSNEYANVPSAIEMAIEAHQGSLQDALVEVAHSYSLNANGELEAIDIQGLLVSKTVASQIGQISSLKRIRLGTESDLSVEESISHEGTGILKYLLVNNQELTSLEIPNMFFKESEFQAIGSLKHLRHLQLPCPTNSFCPERIPFRVPRAEVGTEYLHLAESNSALVSYTFDEDDNYIEHSVSDASIGYLKDLEELEYLLMPGFMLSERSLDTLKTLPRLKELHAPFSVADQVVLSELAKISRLESLTVGVMEDTTSAIDLLKGLPSLRTLQVFVFGDSFSQDEQSIKDFQLQLESWFPAAETHVVPLPLTN